MRPDVLLKMWRLRTTASVSAEGLARIEQGDFVRRDQPTSLPPTAIWTTHASSPSPSWRAFQRGADASADIFEESSVRSRVPRVVWIDPALSPV